MAGIRYEITNEASTQRCENIKDNDPIITSQGTQETWKSFKDNHTDWYFGDPINIDIQTTPYFHIWKTVGKQLCQHFDNGMRYVEQNSPPPANHFILVIDHSSSMNSFGFFDWVGRILYTDPENLSPWQHLLNAVKEFINIRIRKACLTDRMSIVLFGTRALRLRYLEELSKIDITEIGKENPPKV
ncbi:unnamed protein product [Rotaria sp. Silwood1]|nr:unnamed protein product [Rotaria sp. Silwood1]